MTYSARADKPGRAKTWWEGLPNSVLLETAWERQMNLAGIDAYEAARENTTASDTDTGLRVIRKCIATATKAVEEMQRSMIIKDRVATNLRATTLSVPAETSALLTLKVMVDHAYGAVNPNDGANFHKVTMAVSKAIEQELNFRNWVQSSKEAARAYAKTEGITKIPRSIAERMIEEAGGDITRRLRQWRKVFKELNEYSWDDLEQHYCGDALVLTIAEALPEIFAIHVVPVKGRNTKHLKMTEEFRSQFDVLESKKAQLQAVKKPMLTRPKKWERNE